MLNMLHNDYSYRMIGNQKVKNLFFTYKKVVYTKMFLV